MPTKTEEFIYSWRGHTRAAVDAQVFGEFVEEIGPECSAETLLAHAKGSPIHDLFEWNNTEAGHQYRLTQARYYLRSYRVKVRVLEHRGEQRNVKVRVACHESADMPARVHVTTNKLGSTYMSVEALKEDKDALQSALAECFKSLVGLRQRYSFLSDLDGVWAAIDAARNKYAKSISA